MFEDMEFAKGIKCQFLNQLGDKSKSFILMYAKVVFDNYSHHSVISPVFKCMDFEIPLSLREDFGCKHINIEWKSGQLLVSKKFKKQE